MGSHDAFVGLDPAALWAHFSAIAAIPRQSGQESAIAEWVAKWADTCGFPFRRDAAGNICVYVPASRDSPGSKTVGLQAHLDMVCVRAEDSASDPAIGNIEIIREGPWIVAPSSTLGADNGIGIAAAMCVAESKFTPHGPLELLFTVEEETTLKGADKLDPSLIHAKVMVNLDAETSGALEIGCAGGTWTVLRWPAPTEPVPEGWLVADIAISGLRGGHSGLDIAKNRLNGIKGIVWVIRRIAKDIPIRLSGIEGGDAFNAIPIRAHATIAFPPAEAPNLEESLAVAHSRLVARFSDTDPGFSLSKASVDPQGIRCWSEESRDRLLDLLTIVPSGVIAMEKHSANLVETSSNLGVVGQRGDVVEVHCLSRSSVAIALEETVASIEIRGAIGRGRFHRCSPGNPSVACRSRVGPIGLGSRLI